jgi:hypothetical protein
MNDLEKLEWMEDVACEYWQRIRPAFWLAFMLAVFWIGCQGV